MKPLALALVLLIVLAPASAQAFDPEDDPRYPTVPPVRERTFVPDDQVSWTLRKGEAAVPLTLVPTPGRTALALAGGWLLLGPDLDLLPSTFDLLGPGQPAGSPWAQAADNAIVFVTGSPGELAVLYPDTAVVVKQKFELTDLSHFVLTAGGLVFVQGRRASGMDQWNKPLREVQPLPFFPSDLTSADDGTGWASDSLQARPWRQEEGFWKPLELPKAPGRLTTLAPFPDSTGYFAGGPGWVGAFSSDGTAFWTREKDFTGVALPRDLRVRTGSGRLYLWSAQARKVWCWGWDTEGPVGRVGAFTADRLVELLPAEADRLEAQGSVPEALGVVQYGLDLARSQLQAQPFSALWTAASTDWAARRQALRDRVVGAGVLILTWSAPNAKPLANWTWEPDAAWSDVPLWRVTMRPFWEGRAYETDDFKLAMTAELAPWPNVTAYLQGALKLPSWMNLELRPDGTDAPVHWTRVALPAPTLKYDLPVE